MEHSLIQVGNSKAIIIPAKILKKRQYDADSRFDILETSDGIKLVEKNPSLDLMSFPKVERPVISEKVRRLRGIVRFSEEEIRQDERLKYILSR